METQVVLVVVEEVAQEVLELHQDLAVQEVHRKEAQEEMVLLRPPVL